VVDREAGARLIRATARYEVWSAPEEGGRSRVLKGLSSTVATDDTWVRRFADEARAVRRLNHPGILAIKELRRVAKQPVQVLEDFDAIDLFTIKERLTAAQAALSKDVVLAIGAELGRALDHAHRSDVCHGYLGPQSVLLAEDGTLKLTDFMLGAGGPLESRIAEPGDPSVRGDVAAVGRLLAWLIGGAEVVDRSAIRRRIAEGDFALDGRIVDTQLEEVVGRCSGAAAYPSAAALVEACLGAALLSPKDTLATWRAEMPPDVSTALDLRALTDDEPEPRTMPDQSAIEVDVETRYQILEPIGFGGMGAIHRAIQVAVGREVAIKTLHDEDDPDRVQRFHNEAKLVSQLRHPNTVRVFDFGQREGGALFLVTELLRGESLEARIESRGRLDAKTTVRILIDVAEALSEAHGLGIIHRDINSRNLFLDKVGDRERIKVLDFGLAKDAESSPLTQAGMIVGTPSYMSPEQAQAIPITPASDIYSLGVTAYQCLAGVLPFTGGSVPAILRQHLHDAPKPFAALDPPVEVPHALEALVMWMLAKSPEKRPASATVLGAKLREVDATLPEPKSKNEPQSWVGRELHSYRLTDEIGRGVGSRVYKAVHTVLGRTAAIKVLNDLGLDHPSMHQRLKREAQVLASLDHPAILKVQDFGVSPEGVPYLVSELISGLTLRQVLTAEGALPPSRVARIARQITSALALAHDKGVVHRDLKPGNVMLLSERNEDGSHGRRSRTVPVHPRHEDAAEDGDARDAVKVLDFGLARIEGPDDRTHLTKNESLIGSPGYMSPEQIETPSAAGPASDLYALGCVIYALLTGGPPFRGKITEVLEQQRHAAPPPLPPSGGLERLVMHLLQKRPQDRPTSAAEVLAELERLEREVPPRSGTVTQPLAPSPRAAARSRTRVVMVALAAILAGIGGAVLVTILKR